jgi:hypothetical protein
MLNQRNTQGPRRSSDVFTPHPKYRNVLVVSDGDDSQEAAAQDEETVNYHQTTASAGESHNPFFSSINLAA